ncbi:MAG: TonB-dependent receptor, partial [Pyrinomonadaceae bacterium]
MCKLRRTPLSRWAAVLVCAFAFAFPVAAQSNKGTITGTVTDPNGAVVKEANVTATNTATGETRTAKTSEDGTYVIPALDPGVYSVRIEASGFTAANVEEVKLETGARQAVDVAMTVGGVAGETVTVTAEAPLAETETSVRGDLITGREVTDLPLPQRNFTLLATLSPGVTRPAVGTLGGGGNFTSGGVGESTESTRFRESGGSVLAVNGARVTQNNFMLDGVDNNETQFGQIAIFPDPDAIAEFRIDTSVPPAESGRAGGAVISTTIKSGGNDFHGTLYEFYQGAFASAKPTNNPNPGNFVQHNYGGVIGGPIFLPNFGEGGPTYWSGRNKSFFFFSYNKQKGGRPIPEFGFVTVPTARMRAGDFGELLTGGTSDFLFPLAYANPTGAPCALFNRNDPNNTTPANATNLQCKFPTGTLFTPNGVPVAGNDLRTTGLAFSPAGQALLNAYPLPTQGGLQNNYARNRKFIFDQKAYTTRLDHAFNQSNTLFGRYSFSNLGRARENNFPLGTSPNNNDLPSGFGAGNEFGKTRQIALGDTHTFTPTVVNDARAGYSRVEIGIFNTGVFGAGGFSPTVGNQLGIAGSNIDSNSSGIPLIGVSDVPSINQLEFVGDGGPFYFTSNNYSFLDTVTVVRGAHTFRVGGDLRVRQNTQFDAGRAGAIKGQYQYGTSAGGFLSGNYNGIGPEDAGSGTANLLLGYAPAFASRGIISYQFLRSNKEIAFFVQDDWKATPTLTLNLGLRYDMYTAPTERFDAQYNFDPASGRLVRAGDASGLGRDLANTDKNNFAPRVGFAWSGLRDDRRMVVRGGYGVVYTPDVSGQLPLAFNAPTSSSYNCTLQGSSGAYNCSQLTTATNLDTGIPIPPTSTVFPDSFVPDASQRIFYVDPNNKTSLYHQYNLTFQYEFMRNFLFDVAYVGSAGRNLLRVQNIGQSLTTGPGSQEVAGFNEVVTTRFNGSSRFDAFQAKVERRFTRGFSMLSSYTWAHGIDDTPGGFSGQSLGPSRYGPQNPLRPELDRGNSDLDVRHHFKFENVLELPFGRGRRFGGDVPAALDYVIGGWQFNNNITIASGPVYSVVIGGQRPDLIGDPTPTAEQRARGLEFNPDAFAFPVTPIFGGAPCSPNAIAGSERCFGNLGRNTFRGQAQEFWDSSLFKNIPIPGISEDFKVQLRVQAYNVLNHINHFVPNRDVNFSIQNGV